MKNDTYFHRVTGGRLERSISNPKVFNPVTYDRKGIPSRHVSFPVLEQEIVKQTMWDRESKKEVRIYLTEKLYKELKEAKND